ncbi:MAG: hypothetical protein ACI4TU_03690 [Candidatus Cryptobacteroides sp.]
MKKLLTSRAGATFNLECPDFTYVIRKDVIEIVFKVKSGVFIVINFARVDSSRGMMFAGWGNYWNRLTNLEKQLPQVAKTCPVLYDLLTGKDKDGVVEMEFGSSPQDFEHGFGLEVSLPANVPLMLCLNTEIIKKAGMLRNKMTIIYNELVMNPPFPAWKLGLDELWE